ncbi:MAG: hypothetical protein ACYTG0_43375, partial [Planctomycetota bacterium]
DNLRAKDALTDKGYAPEEQDVILVELLHKPGMLKHVAEILSYEKIDISHVYATALGQDEKCLLVLHTSNDVHALPRLNRVQAK